MTKPQLGSAQQRYDQHEERRTWRGVPGSEPACMERRHEGNRRWCRGLALPRCGSDRTIQAHGCRLAERQTQQRHCSEAQSKHGTLVLINYKDKHTLVPWVNHQMITGRQTSCSSFARLAAISQREQLLPIGSKRRVKGAKLYHAHFVVIDHKHHRSDKREA